MAEFERSYLSEHPPEDLWRAINTPLLDPDLASLVHEDLLVTYDVLGSDGQIDGGTAISYVASNEAVNKVAPVYRQFIPKDVTFYVARMALDYEPGHEVLRHDVLVSDKAEGSVTRTVEAEEQGSKLIIAATLSIKGIGNMFDHKLAEAMRYCIGDPSEHTIELLPEILGS